MLERRAQLKSGLGEQDDPRFKDHAWFVSFAPVEDPKIVVVALVENGGHGGSHAAPVVREVLKEFFQKRGVLSIEDWESAPQLPELPDWARRVPESDANVEAVTSR